MSPDAFFKLSDGESARRCRLEEATHPSESLERK